MTSNVQSPPPLPPFDRDRPGFTFSAPPNPEWAYGKTPADDAWRAEGDAVRVIDTSTIDSTTVYKYMIGGVIPKPVAFVSSISEDGIENLAPYSWFNMVTHDPPMISISILTGAQGSKDSARNIRAPTSNGFTVSLISTPWVEAANACSIDAPPSVGEWGFSGLTKAPSTRVKAPRVKESAFSMECELAQAVEIKHPETGRVTTTLILAHVRVLHIREAVLTAQGTIDPAAYQVLGRLGDGTYCRVTDGFRLPKSTWATEEDAIVQALVGK